MTFIDVFSREQAIVLAPRENTVVISISGPNNPATLRHGWENVLRLEFHDIVENPRSSWILNTECDEFETPVTFDEEMADKLWRFIHANLEKSFCIHCDAGISRSVAVGVVVNELIPGSFLKLHAVRDTRFANGLILRLLHNKRWQVE